MQCDDGVTDVILRFLTYRAITAIKRHSAAERIDCWPLDLPDHAFQALERPPYRRVL